MDTSLLPEKYFYTIGDVCKMTGTKPHILRYWESQFKLLRPARRYSGHRKYTQREIDLINKIKFLVIDRKFTLAGAKREINREQGKHTAEGSSSTVSTVVSAQPGAFLKELKKDVEECLSMLRPAPVQQELIKF